MNASVTKQELVITRDRGGRMAYIKLFKDSISDHRIYELADRIEAALEETERRQLRSLTTLGILMRLWSYADTYITSDDQLHISLPALAAALNVPVTVLEKFPAEWLQLNANGGVTLPGYCKRNRILGKDARKVAYVRKLESNRRYKRRIREASSDHPDNGQEGSSEASSSHLGRRITGTGTGTSSGTSGTVRKSAPHAAPSRRAAAPRIKPGESSWIPVSASAPASGTTFDQDFEKRFGVKPASDDEEIPT